MSQKDDNFEKNNSDAGYTTLTLKFNDKSIKAIKAIGRDLAVSAGINALTFATGVTNMPDFSSSLSQSFAFAAIGIAAVAAGITAGRYIGGGTGALLDKSGLTSEAQKTGAIIGATLTGAATHLVYHSGLWVMAFYKG